MEDGTNVEGNRPAACLRVRFRVVDNEDYSTVGIQEFQAELEMNAGTEPDNASRDAAKSYDDIDTKDSLKCPQHSEGESCNLHGIGAGQDDQECCYAETSKFREGARCCCLWS